MISFRRSILSLNSTKRLFICATQPRNNLQWMSSSSKDNNKPPEEDPNHPIRRTLRILANDINRMKTWFNPKTYIEKQIQLEDDLDNTLKKYVDDSKFQTHCDVLIIGGGGVGSSVAYWLKKKARDGLNVVVVEKDSTYQKCSTVLSVGGLRQQFSLPENIQMSLYGADFIRTVKDHLGDDVELNFTPHGYLVLATEQGAETLSKNSKLQNELGARNEILTASKLKQKFPWLNTNDIALGCHGLEKEGWFDPWALLMGYKRRAKEYGAHYVDGTVVDFEYREQPDMKTQGSDPADTYNSLDKVVVQMANGEKRTIKFALCLIAAGAHSGQVGKLAKIGTGNGILSIPLPVEPRKRYVYVMNCQGSNAPGLNTPLTVDPTNTYFRRDGLGGNYLAGRSPSAANEPNIDNLDVDYEYFNTDIWPHLAERIPAFESIKVTNAWAGYYEFNTFDENGIIGTHPYYHNLYIATGFSGHGIQQTPAVGRAISELIIDGAFREIDLTRLGFDRIIVHQPMFEVNCV